MRHGCASGGVSSSVLMSASRPDGTRRCPPQPCTRLVAQLSAVHLSACESSITRSPTGNPLSPLPHFRQSGKQIRGQRSGRNRRTAGSGKAQPVTSPMHRSSKTVDFPWDTHNMLYTARVYLLARRLRLARLHRPVIYAHGNRLDCSTKS